MTNVACDFLAIAFFAFWSSTDDMDKLIALYTRMGVSHFSQTNARGDLHGIPKAPSRAVLDSVLAKGGLEAITESYYSAMRPQQQSGGQ